MRTQTKDKLRGISYLMMVLVVYSHCATYGWPSLPLILEVCPASWYLFVQYWIYLEIPRFVVPLFFGISGYFLVANRDSFPTFSQFYSYKLRSRLKSVLVPYLTWSIAAVVIVGLSQCNPMRSSDYKGEQTFNLPLTEILSKMFVKPTAFHLWFLQELMVLVITFPLYLWMARRIPWFATIMLGLIWTFNWCGETPRLYVEGLVFFFVGILWAVRNLRLPAIPSWAIRTLSAGWLGLTLLNSYLYMVGFRYVARFTENASEIIGVIVIWHVYDVFPQRIRQILGLLSPYGFYLYLVHIPLELQLKNAFFKLFHPTSATELVALLFIPIVVIVTVTGSAPLVKRYCGPFYRLLTGGR